MTHIALADARDWMDARRRDAAEPAALILTDPPHLDTFESVDAHAAFVRWWVPKSMHLLNSRGTLYHSCGASPAELANYLDVRLPDQILVWPHEVANRSDGSNRLFAPAHHFHLMYRRSGAPALRWSGDTVVSLAKPYELWTSIISAICDPDALVIDPFCGRGEIPTAAVMAGRRYEGCEILLASVEHCWSLGL